MMLGLAVGDALGGPLEFLSKGNIESQFDGPVTEMIGGGWQMLAPGQTTDDTAMALCLLRSLVQNAGYDRADVLDNYLAWLATSPPDVGQTIRSVLSQIAKGVDPDKAAHTYHRVHGLSAGNGALMRIAPLALISDKAERDHAAKQDSDLTHFDDLSASSCVLFLDWIAAALDDQEPNFSSKNHQLQEVLEWDQRELVKAVNSKPGFVLTALGAAKFAWQKEFEPALVEIVNMGGDADTNGAIVGALLGARDGDSLIPARWLAMIQEQQEIKNLVSSWRN